MTIISYHVRLLKAELEWCFFFFFFFFVVSAITVVNAKRETVFFGKNWYDILYNKCIYTKYDDDDSDWKKYVT